MTSHKQTNSDWGVSTFSLTQGFGLCLFTLINAYASCDTNNKAKDGNTDTYQLKVINDSTDTLHANYAVLSLNPLVRNNSHRTVQVP